MDSRDKRQGFVMGVHIRGNRDTPAGLIWGGIIVIVGLVLLLNHLNILAVERLYRFWPLLLVFFGIGYLFTRSGRGWGIFLIVIGAMFQLRNLGIVYFRFEDLWPLFIIALGLFLMWGALKRPTLVKGNGDDSDAIHAVAIFGGAERRIASHNFKGGRAFSLFGGVELDFRDADIEGEEARLDVNCVFGGVEIRVPENWQVDSHNIPVLGGYSDKSRNATSADAATQRKRLVITGVVLFGGVEIRN